MPKVVVTGGVTAVEFSVSDKQDAIRKISERLQRQFPKKYVETVLNEWLASQLRITLMINYNNEKMHIRYED